MSTPSKRRLGLIAGALVLAIGPWTDLAAGGNGDRAKTTRVSVSSHEAQAKKRSNGPVISADGRFIAFHSNASNLVGGDTNGRRDVFVRDRRTGRTERVSLGFGGAQASKGSSFPSISANGRFIAFSSKAPNLTRRGDTTGHRDIFVHDRTTGRTKRVSVSPDGGPADGQSDGSPAISATGRFVAFSSHATNLVPGDTNRHDDVFVHDIRTGETTRVSLSSGGMQTDKRSGRPAISADGRFVTFEAEATNLVGADTNGHADIFVHDRRTGVTERVSVNSAADQGRGNSRNPSISANGRLVAFTSGARNLVRDDTNHEPDVFVHDRRTGRNERVSISSGGMQGNHPSDAAVMSGGGRFVAFHSKASTLIPRDPNERADVFVHDRKTDETRLVSVGFRGAPASGDSSSPAISAAGRHISFESKARNLVPSDTNRESDIFVRGPLKWGSR
jgi:Tol biopolymer transport system component